MYVHRWTCPEMPWANEHFSGWVDGCGTHPQAKRAFPLLILSIRSVILTAYMLLYAPPASKLHHTKYCSLFFLDGRKSAWSRLKKHRRTSDQGAFSGMPGCFPSIPSASVRCCCRLPDKYPGGFHETLPLAFRAFHPASRKMMFVK